MLGNDVARAPPGGTEGETPPPHIEGRPQRNARLHRHRRNLEKMVRFIWLFQLRCPAVDQDSSRSAATCTIDSACAYKKVGHGANVGKKQLTLNTKKHKFQDVSSGMAWNGCGAGGRDFIYKGVVWRRREAPRLNMDAFSKECKGRVAGSRRGAQIGKSSPGGPRAGNGRFQ